MRTMFDAVDPGGLPRSAVMVAGYVDGLYDDLVAIRAAFPHALAVSIAVAWTDRAEVLDVESGNATPAQAVTWCTQTMADVPNSQLTVYCDASNWPAVRAAFQSAGVSEPQYWIAAYDGSATIPAGAIAHQYLSTDAYDVSVCADFWPGVDPAPTPPSPPSPPEDDMPLTAADAKLVVDTLFDTPVWEAGDTPQNRTFQQLLEYLDQHYGNEVQQITALSAQVTALSAALAALAKGELTAAEVQAAVAAALTAAGHPPVAA